MYTLIISSRDSKLLLHLTSDAFLVGARVHVWIIEDVVEVELVVLVHVHVQTKHRGAVATEAAGLCEDASLHDHAHGKVGTVKDGHLLHLLSLGLNQGVVLDGLNGVNFHVSIKSWLYWANSERLSFDLVARDVLVKVIYHL